MAQSAETYAGDVAQARELLEAGNVGKARSILEHVVYNTHDPELLAQIQELGQEGLANSGRFGKGAWKHIASAAELSLQNAAIRNGNGSN